MATEESESMASLSLEALLVAAKNGDSAARVELASRLIAGTGRSEAELAVRKQLAAAAQSELDKAWGAVQLSGGFPDNVPEELRTRLEKARVRVDQLDDLHKNDQNEGFKLLMQVIKDDARKASDPSIQFAVANLYEAGIGTATNLQEAFAWTLRAAKQEHLAAMVSVGASYVLGAGVEKNTAEGRLWFERAAQRGSVDGVGSLAVFYTIFADKKDFEKAYMYGLVWRQIDPTDSRTEAHLRGCVQELMPDQVLRAEADAKAFMAAHGLKSSPPPPHGETKKDTTTTRAVQDQASVASGVTLYGRVLQVVDGGLLVSCEPLEPRDGVVMVPAFLSDKPERVIGLFYVVGHPRQKQLVDDDTVLIKARQDGVFSYTSAGGSQKTIRKYMCIEDYSKPKS
jgi:hypothetical protein